MADFPGVDIGAREDELEFIQQLVQVGSWSLDHRTGHFSWSRELFRILGLDPDTHAVSHEYFLNCVHHDDRDRFNRVRVDAITQSEPVDFMYRLLLQDGTVKYVQERSQTAFGEQGEPRMTRGSVQDVSERVRQANESRRALHLLRTALEILDCGFWEWDVERDRTTWSEKVYEIFDRDPALGPVVYPHVQDYFTNESWEVLGAAIERCVTQGEPYECETEMILPNGQRRWTVSYGYRETGLAGNATVVYGLVRDMTQRKRIIDEIDRKLHPEKYGA